MISALKKLFGITTVDLPELIKNGATIIDVRSSGEFDSGHVKGSINIPLEQIPGSIEKLKNTVKSLYVAVVETEVVRHKGF